MALQNFVDKVGPVISAAWLNLVDRFVIGPGVAPNEQTSSEIVAGITPVNYAYQPRDFRRYGGVADGVTDNTSVMLTVCNAMGGTFFAPYNLLYDRTAFIAGVDSDVVLMDESQINDLTSPGETTKHLGITSSDIATNDSTWGINSGHHPNLLLNNFGSSGTFSADHRIVSLVWAAGQFQLAGLAKRGSRGCATMQFLNVPTTDYWTWRVTLNAPWLSIQGEYEDWFAGEVIPGTPVYRRASGAHYVSASAGTTAAPAPSHTSGTAPDGGGVQWTFLDSADQGLYQLDQFGRVLIGSDAVNFTWEHRTRAVDPGGGSYSFLGAPYIGAISKTAEFHLYATNGAGADLIPPFLRATTSTQLAVLRGAGSTLMGYWHDTDGLVLSSVTLSQSPSASSPAVGTGGTIDTTNVGVAKVTPAGAVTGVILEAGIKDGQEVTVMNQSGSSITFAAYATSNVASGTACVIAATTAKRFVWDSVAAAWYENT